MSQYLRSYTSLIDYLLAFAMSGISHESDADSEYPRTHGAITGFVHGSFSGPGAQIGDLVRLDSMSNSEFRLGWYLESRSLNGYEEHLIQSAKTGKQCWWSNVGLSYLNRKTLSHHPEWRWIDEQHKFNDRWIGACHEYHDAYIWRATWAVFNEDGSVSIGVRKRHCQPTDPRPSIKLTDWQSFHRKELADIYTGLVQLAEKEQSRVRNQHLPS